MIKQKSLRIFFRSFFIQSFWNREGLQNIGFAYMIMPFVREIYKDSSEKFISVMKRHLDHFVTNPYLSSAVAALVIYREEELAKNGGGDARELSTFKRYLSASIAAIGDSVIWGCLRPVNSIVGCLPFFLFADKISSSLILVSLFFYLFFYNLITLSIRYWSGFLAFKYKMQMLVLIKRLPVALFRNILCVCGLIVCIFSAGFYWLKYGGDLMDKAAGFIFLACFLIFKMFNFSTIFVFLMGLAVSFVITYLGIL